MASLSTQALTNHDSSLLKVKTARVEAKLEHGVASSGPSRSPRLGSPGVIARLQALFPPSPAASPVADTFPSFPNPDFIKTRIITWNMHDSLPKGNLEELLGSVPSYTPRLPINDGDRMALPGLSMEETHPYHIVVVGGQECPTLSGIPMGLAANFKHWDVKEKERERHKDHDQDKDRDRDKKEKYLLHHTKSLLSKHLKHEHTSDHPRYDHAAEDSQAHNPALTSGWSAVLEDWFANGVGSLHDVKPVVTTTVSNLGGSSVGNDNDRSNPHKTTPHPNPPRSNTLGVNWQSVTSGVNTDSFSTCEAQARTGPYELLVKERLMGIYMAIYVHRDVRPFVQGVSTGTVPAGLMGGRLGNKGGVGVSVNFRGTTLLFINAHLAAHEDKVPLRVANLAKIKAELPLESFLSPDDHRTFAEDLTDRFDHTWIFGDLNFRLDISRLHADWLVSRKEYSQALAFDQLSKLIKDGDPTFAGLHEATISFPPTFKYDVLRRVKQHEKRRSRHVHQQRSKSNLDEIEEKEDGLESGVTHHEENDDDEMGDVTSLGSSAWTSNQSKHRLDAMEDGSDGSSISSHVGRDIILNQTPKLVSHAALKAKAVWMALLKASRDAKVNNLSPKRKRGMGKSAVKGAPGSSVELSNGTRPTSIPSATSLNLPISRGIASAKPTSAHRSPEDKASSECDKGVYDSSSKQRVPSWCDRILWKTTVEPPENPEPELEFEPEAEPNRSRGRANRVGQLLTQAFRSRVRRDSIQAEPDSQALSGQEKSGCGDTSLTSSPGLFQSKSLEPLPSNSRQYIAPSLGVDGHRRPRSVSAMAASSERVPRRFSLPVSPRPAGLMSSTRRSEGDQLPASLSQDHLDLASSTTVAVRRVIPRRWFFNFRSRDPPSPINPPNVEPFPARHTSYRKGDVVCLSYRTLDDRQMQRLEGRSDHRPVIGSYAIYV